MEIIIIGSIAETNDVGRFCAVSGDKTSGTNCVSPAPLVNSNDADSSDKDENEGTNEVFHNNVTFLM